jgi:hydrogenase maturation protease
VSGQPAGADRACGGGRRPCVIGLGNSEMGDDGIGVHLVRLLREQRDRGEWGASAGQDAGGVELLLADGDPFLAGARIAEGGPVLLVDAIDMRRQPGSCRVFRPEDADFPAAAPAASTHSLATSQVVEIARGLGCAGSLRLMGVQLAEARPGRGLSPAVREKVPEMLERIKEEVELLP